LQVRLSDRIAVEIVDILKQQGLIRDIVHTANGREYITKAKVKEEIKQILKECGGRIAVVELPGLMGIDLAHCLDGSEAIVKVWACRQSIQAHL
jgi:E3 UFM1-protein ligase 1